METKRRKALIITILAAVVVLAILIFQNIPMWSVFLAKKDVIVFKRNANSSAGIHYKYELDRDDILREVDHYSARHFISCGPSYSEVWEFEIIGEGEVTVSWTRYDGGAINDAMSFYETYLVKDGERTKIFDSRDAA